MLNHYVVHLKLILNTKCTLVVFKRMNNACKQVQGLGCKILTLGRMHQNIRLGKQRVAGGSVLRTCRDSILAVSW